MSFASLDGLLFISQDFQRSHRRRRARLDTEVSVDVFDMFMNRAPVNGAEHRNHFVGLSLRQPK